MRVTQCSLCLFPMLVCRILIILKKRNTQTGIERQVNFKRNLGFLKTNKVKIFLKDQREGVYCNWGCNGAGAAAGATGFCVPAYNQIRKHVFVNTLKSWSAAQTYCRENHIDLATVHSQEEAQQLLNIAGASLIETNIITERYTLIEELKNWTEAQQYCREHHTDLVSIKNASENEDLVKKAQGKPFWIGLFNEPWKWSHQGDNYTFHYWVPQSVSRDSEAQSI
ncbi:UNVERIFIED_CONTAM: hypothetical protein FKN15_061986 [Acipenser sinensis]